MLPKFKKLQKENDEVNAASREKDLIIRTNRNDLMKINTERQELALKLDQLKQRFAHETKILRDEKKKVE